MIKSSFHTKTRKISNTEVDYNENLNHYFEGDKLLSDALTRLMCDIPLAEWRTFVYRLQVICKQFSQ